MKIKSTINRFGAGAISLVLAAMICVWGFTPVNVKAADKSTTSDNTVKVAAANAMAVMCEMLGANVVSSSEATLTIGKDASMPQFLTTFAIDSNNVNADPWLVNYYNANGYKEGDQSTNYGWDGFTGTELKPISNATVDTLPTNADMLINKPDMVILSTGQDNTTSSNSNGYYGVNEAGFGNANAAMGNTNKLEYMVSNALSTPQQLEENIENAADHIENIMKTYNKTTRYGDPKQIADNFVKYFDANEQKAKDLTSSLPKRKIIHIESYNANTKLYTVIPTSQNDIYGSTYIQDGGGENVATGTTMTGSQISAALETDGVITARTRAVYDQVGQDESLKSVKRYQAPTGVYLWSVRAPEGALCSLWVADILHGDQTVEYNGKTDKVSNFINIVQTAADYYKTFYHYSDSESAANKLSDIINTSILAVGTIPDDNDGGDTGDSINTVRLGGSDRYATSTAISGANWDTSDNAVLVSGQAFADALSAAPLAKKLDAPILLTPSGSLNSGVSSELTRLKVKKVYIIGGTGSVSGSVENTLKSMNMNTQRIGGADRYATSLAVAEQLGTNPSQILMASGSGYADGLSASSYAALSGSPILLINGKSISSDALSYVKGSKAKVYALGGTGVMADSVVSGTGAQRIGGSDRYATNLAVLKQFSDSYDLSKVYLASGSGFADALSGSAAAGKENAPIVLVPYGSVSAQNNYIKSDPVASKLKSVEVLGGTGVLTDDVVNQIIK